jgi:hypothetical protein
MEEENRVDRVRYREKREEKRGEIYRRVMECLMPYRLCALTSAELNLSLVRSMQQWR